MAYLVSELITTLRDEGMLPPSDESAGATRLLATLNREQRLFLAELLLSVREGFQVAHVDAEAISGSTTRWRIPSRAIGAKLKVVTQLVGGAPSILYPMPYERQVEDYGGGMPGDFWLEGSTLVLRSPLSAPATLRLTYYRRLGVLVAENEAAEIEAIDFNTNEVTIPALIPGSFTASRDYDFIQGQPHFDLLAANQTATRAGSVLTFAEDLPPELSVGDYVTLPGETPICQAPVELHDVLALRAAYVTLSALADPKAAATEARMEAAKKSALSILAPRIDGTPHVLINPNGPGMSRWIGRGRR